MSRQEELERYVELTEWIRELSCPQVEGIRTVDEYRKRFVRNYVRIHELARTSSGILADFLDPLLDADRPLTEEETEDLFAFVSALLDATTIECVDVPLRERVIDRLLKDAEEKDDLALILKALDARIETCFFMMGSVSRISDVRDMYSAYREKGLEAADRILIYLDKDKFAALTDYALKEIVLINSRYINAVIDDAKRPEPKETLQLNLDAMKRALALAEDPFFIDQASRYNWKYHTYRALQGIAFMTDYMNESGADEEMLREINLYTRQMVALWKQDRVVYGALCEPEVLYQSMYRNAYLAGEMTLTRFRKKTVELIDNADQEDFSHDGNMNLIFSQTEYMMTLDASHLTAEQKRNVKRFYRDLTGYVHRMPKVGSLSFLLIYLKHALDSFIEFEGGPVYLDLIMEILASVLPEVYMHSMGVAALSGELARFLYRKEPERFHDVPGGLSEEAAVTFAYRVGMLHDVGKLMIAERVLTYSRERFDEEEIIYRTGPEIGAYLLKNCDSTRPYAEAVRTHHFHYDKTDAFSGLYGGGLKSGEGSAVSHIVGLANDMEWMTSEIRYSKAQQLTYEEFCDGAREASGTRYAPYVITLLDDPDCDGALRTVLDEGRENIFRETFDLLKAGVGG